MNMKKQFQFYQKLKPITMMSHPNGSYSKDTLKVLNKIGLELGFWKS